MLSYLPLAHVLERTLIEFGQLESGMHVYFAETLETFTADLQRARPTVFFSVPRLWVKFQQGVLAQMSAAKLEWLLRLPVVKGMVSRKILGALGLDQCIFAVGGAAPMPQDLLRWYSKLGLNIGEGYGMTENLAICHIAMPGKRAFGTVGQPYDGVQCRLDPSDGEIQMKSPATMLGYYKQPELSRLAFTEDGWLHTGDKGVLDAAGNLKITGRVAPAFPPNLSWVINIVPSTRRGAGWLSISRRASEGGRGLGRNSYCHSYIAYLRKSATLRIVSPHTSEKGL
jgi:long-chain acyl-CoA synthetase